MHTAKFSWNLSSIGVGGNFDAQAAAKTGKWLSRIWNLTPRASTFQKLTSKFVAKMMSCLKPRVGNFHFLQSCNYFLLPASLAADSSFCCFILSRFAIIFIQSGDSKDRKICSQKSFLHKGQNILPSSIFMVMEAMALFLPLSSIRIAVSVEPIYDSSENRLAVNLPL
jgi:hypothetical protein